MVIKISTIRHSLSHILAYAVQELYPKTKFGIGPAIENGFYYDFDFSTVSNLADRPDLTQNKVFKMSPENLLRIEKKMKELVKKDIKFRKKIIIQAESKKLFKNQPYKSELIKDLIKEKQGDKISIYESGDFIDLCKGPHIRSAKEIPIDGFKLTKIAGAYWKGDEKNQMLTRIYGVAFETKKQLNEYLQLQKEIEKRDHRILGKKLDLFHINEDIGPGLILWHPKGAILKKIIEDYILNEYLKNDYKLVCTPHIAKLNLWETSGHTDFYKESMFPPIHLKEINQEEKSDYQIKPMNCPFHIAIYKQKIRSYKELPLRYTELGTVYRYERSGTLHGLVRVRGFTQDDAHIFCAPEHLGEELMSTLKLTLHILKTFGFKDYAVYLSTRPKKYVGTIKNWDKATKSLKYALEKLKMPYQLDPGEGVFYGPKIDIKIKDFLGRDWQCTTIQVDFNLPDQFEMNYINQKSKKERPIMIHRALLGSLERFIGILIEHYAGSFPLWLAPEQIWIIPIGSAHQKYAKEVMKKLNESGSRCELKDKNETVSKKIREGEIQKIPYLLVVGDKEKKNKTIRVRQRDKGDIGEMKLDKFLKKIESGIENKR